MSYAKMMKWNKRHRTSKKTQPVLMHTDSGFWPAKAWLEHNWWPYLERCKAAGVQPMECEQYYKSQLR